MNDTTRRAVLLCSLLAFSLAAAGRDFEDSYQRVRPPQPTLTPSGIEVLEIFWYGCPHCYSLEPHLEKWLESKPENVEFVRLPGVLNTSWIPHARAFYTAQKLGVLDQIHRPLFDALHRDRKAIFSEGDLREFFEAHGVDGKEFTRVYHSSEVETRLKQALVLARNYKVTGVPALIVNGKYLTSASLAGNHEDMLKVVDRLVERERLAAAE